ncbi:MULTISPECIES: hypothetical protein [unclassified Aeromonas]|nr:MULTISPECIES: hypothetical protein [unclassified Aeromonas]
MTELVCTEPGLGIELGTAFQVLSVIPHLILLFSVLDGDRPF